MIRWTIERLIAVFGIGLIVFLTVWAATIALPETNSLTIFVHGRPISIGLWMDL